MSDPDLYGGPSSTSDAATSQNAPEHSAGEIKHDLTNLKDTAEHDLDAISRRAAKDAQNLRDRAGEEVSGATEKAKTFATEQKDLAADQLDGIASAIAKVADELSSGDQATIGRYASELAAGIKNFSGSIKSRDADELIGATQDFGRNQPVAFLGAAALAGFAASRFALASNHRRSTKSKSPSSTPQTANQAYGTRETDDV